MKVLLSWINEFAPFEADPELLADEMSDLGMAVESMEFIGSGLDGIIVAKVLDLRPNPDADRIQLVDVDTGDGEALQICCGAFNMAVGDLIPLATIGTTMPDGMTIAKRKMRGQTSNGMLCSAAEMGMGDDHGGILVLSGDHDPGVDIKEALGIERDVLFDLEINPNRPDAMSVAGVARDLAARLKVPFTIPTPQVATTGGNTADLVSVEILDPDLCGRFYARVLDDVVMGPSPQWIANRLTAAGMRPINRVVDVSNYVMLELGQPNHTYDLTKVDTDSSGRHGLRVRWARDGEAITTLDDVGRTLGVGDGVIADVNDVAIGIAGVMGGASTEIDETTTSVLLEMAWWDPMTIARSSQRLGLRSEASMRFERGCDPQIVELAALRFAQLLDGSSLVGGAVNEAGVLPERLPVVVRSGRVNALLGTDTGDTKLDASDIASYLEPIGFEVADGAAPGEQLVVIPSFRPDTTTETDIIEEIARHHGYSKIPQTLPPSNRIGSLARHQYSRRLVRNALLGLGLDEAMPMPFLAPGDLERAGLEPGAVVITNPLASEESVLRSSLRPGLLKAVSYNQSHRNMAVRLFETGRVFGPPLPGEVLPDEHEHATAVISEADVLEAIEAWSAVAETLSVRDWVLDQVPVAGLHRGRCARIMVAGEPVGTLGELDPKAAEAFGISGRVVVMDVDLDAVFQEVHGGHRYSPISRFPSSDIDLAFEVDESVSAARIAHAITAAAGDLLVALELFDVFRGGSLPEGVRSLAYALRLQASDHTLTDEEVGDVRSRVIRAVESTLSAKLRA